MVHTNFHIQLEYAEHYNAVNVILNGITFLLSALWCLLFTDESGVQIDSR